VLLENHSAWPNFFLCSPPEPTGDKEVELSVMTDVSVTEETNAQIQGGVDDLNDLSEEAARNAECDHDAEEVEENDAPTNEAPEPVIIEVTIGAGATARKVKNVRRIPVSTMAIRDTMATGQSKMQGMDLVNVRLRAKCRDWREQLALQDDLYNFLTSMGEDIDEAMRGVGNVATTSNTSANTAMNEPQYHRELAKLQYNLK
jgi:hypothetical protein